MQLKELLVPELLVSVFFVLLSWAVLCWFLFCMLSVDGEERLKDLSFFLCGILTK